MFCLKNTSNSVSRCSKTFLVLRSLATQANIKSSDEANSSVLDREWLNALSYNEVPRPSKFEYVCSFLPGGKHHNKSTKDFVLSLRKNLGDIFVMPGIFGRPDILMVFNPDHIEKVYRTEGIWPNRTGFETIVHFRKVVRKDFFGDNLFTSQGEDWANLRKIINPVLVQPRVPRLYMNSLVSLNDEFIQRIRDVRDPTTNEVPDNFEEDLNRLMFESISSIVLNKHFGLILRQKENPDALKLFKYIRQFFILFFQLEVQPSMWKFIRTPKFYKIMKCQEEMLRITQKFINEALTEIETQKKTDGEPSVLEKLLKTDEKIAIVLAMDMLLAGVDGTSTLLAGVLLNLAKNPEKQDILRKEILSILPEKDSPLTIESVKNMPYLRACVKETLRIYPVSSGIFRNTGRDIVLGGYQIPKDTITMLNSNLMLSDEKYFSRPQEFIPERWLRRNVGNEVIQGNSHPFSFIPFGFGPRICAGKRIVDMELEIFLSKVIRNFKVEFNYSSENAFRQYFVNVPAIPLRFKFTDV